MIKIIQAEPFHIYTIDAKKEVYGDFSKQMGSVHEAILAGPSVTLCLPNGDSLAIIGAMMLYKGVAEVWAITSERCLKYPVAFHKAVKSVLEKFVKEHNIRRIQIYVRADYEQGYRWAESLGFKPEGVLASNYERETSVIVETDSVYPCNVLSIISKGVLYD